MLIIVGSVLDIAPAVEGSVTITAPFKRSIKRHILFKVISYHQLHLHGNDDDNDPPNHGYFQGADVKICINGTVPGSAQEPVAGQGLKNSAHGQVMMMIKMTI